MTTCPDPTHKDNVSVIIALIVNNANMSKMGNEFLK